MRRYSQTSASRSVADTKLELAELRQAVAETKLTQVQVGLGGGKSEPPLKWIATTVVALTVGVAAPTTALLTGLLQSRAAEESAAMARVRFEHEAKLAYLNVASTKGLDLDTRLSVYRYFVTALKPDDPLRAWADTELQRAEQLLTELKKKEQEIAGLLKGISDQRRRIGTLERQLADAQSPQAKTRIRGELLSAQTDVAAAEREVASKTIGASYQCRTGDGGESSRYRAESLLMAETRCRGEHPGAECLCTVLE